jgi:hypothetical protein
MAETGRFTVRLDEGGNSLDLKADHLEKVCIVRSVMYYRAVN